LFCLGPRGEYLHIEENDTIRLVYSIHQTKALILDVMDVGESNKFYWLLTREYGLVNASAQGVRLVKSKLNPYLQQYGFVIIEFVKGKEIWRITNAAPETSFYFSQLTKKSEEVVAKISLLLKRLYVGEESNEVLFDDLLDGFQKLSKAFDSKTVDALEIVIIIKILYHLGYWEDHKGHYQLHLSSYSQEVLEKALQKKKDLRERITQSLRESHL